MPVIQLEARVSSEQLLRAVDQMSADELETFTERVIELRARRVASVLSAVESLLLERINRAMSSSNQARYERLIEQRDAHALTPSEHDELISLSDDLERLDADRVAAIADLAKLRGVSLDEMMVALGVPQAHR